MPVLLRSTKKSAPSPLRTTRPCSGWMRTAADVGHGRVVDAAPREEERHQADREAPDGAAGSQSCALKAPSATIARKAFS